VAFAMAVPPVEIKAFAIAAPPVNIKLSHVDGRTDRICII